MMMNSNMSHTSIKGVTIAAKNNQLLYVGTWCDFNVWDSNEDIMFNYAIPENI